MQWPTAYRRGMEFASLKHSMIIFLDEDRAYLYWVTHHRKGYVLEGRRKPRIGHLLLHRAVCREIRSGPRRGTHWTTGGKLKACCLDRVELEIWASEATGAPPQHCSVCQPGSEVPDGNEPVHLTKLAGEILDYVLDAALIHMEQEYPPYRLTVGDIAACFGKTPGQISTVLHRLIDDGLVALSGKVNAGRTFPAQRLVLPKIRALRTLDAFRDESDEVLQAELRKLNP
jgi:hypothetical protein